MKRFLFSCCIALLACGRVSGQACTPLFSMPDTVLLLPLPYLDGEPGTGITDTACVGVPFTTYFNLNVPSTITVSGLTFPVISISMPTSGGIDGLPASFTYACNPPNCIFLKDSIGCIAVSGTPPAGSEGVYDLGFTMNIQNSTFPSPIPITLPNGQFSEGNYYLHVRSASDNACQASATKATEGVGISALVRPNPFKDFTEFLVQSPTAGPFRFAVADVLGRPVHQAMVNLSEGENILPFKAMGLSAGCYFYLFENGKYRLYGRFVIE